RNQLETLIKHLAARTESAPAAEKIYVLLALAFAHGWNANRDAALTALTQAAALVPHDVELKLEIAKLQSEMQRLDEALALIHSVTPTDQKTLQQRETLALDLAVRLGKQERAREAAQRLFGMRLDPPAQMTLASQMRRLGMTEEAEQVLARAQRGPS